MFIQLGCFNCPQSERFTFVNIDGSSRFLYLRGLTKTEIKISKVDPVYEIVAKKKIHS